MNTLWYVEMCIYENVQLYMYNCVEEAFAYHYIYYSTYTSIMFN